MTRPSEDSSKNGSIAACPTAAIVCWRALAFAAAVAGGAELLADAPVEISHLVVDATSGGFMSNVTFAANGTIDVVNATGRSGALPLTFSSGTDLDPVANWSLRVDGAISTKHKVYVANGRLCLACPGMILVFR